MSIIEEKYKEIINIVNTKHIVNLTIMNLTDKSMNELKSKLESNGYEVNMYKHNNGYRLFVCPKGFIESGRNIIMVIITIICIIIILCKLF